MNGSALRIAILGLSATWSELRTSRRSAILSSCVGANIRRRVVADTVTDMAKITVCRSYFTDCAPFTLVPDAEFLKRHNLRLLRDTETCVFCSSIMASPLHCQNRIPHSRNSPPLAVGNHISRCGRAQRQRLFSDQNGLMHDPCPERMRSRAAFVCRARTSANKRCRQTITENRSFKKWPFVTNTYV